MTLITSNLIPILTSVLMGTAGGFTHVFVDATSWDDLKKFSSVREITLGTIIGGLYVFLHSDYGFPNFVMTFISGYAGIDFIKGIIEKLTKK